MTLLVKERVTKLVNFLRMNWFLIFIFLFLFKLSIFHYRVIGNDFLNEYREGAIVLNTDLITRDGNPYDLANQPEYTNVYGIFYHIIVYPLAKLFGATLRVHRVVSAFLIVASCFVLFLAMRWINITLFLALAATLLFYGHCLFPGTPFASPDSLGLLLFLCSILIPWKCDFSSLTITISIGFGILAFLTKPYFVVVLPYLTFYLFLFKSKKEGIKYGILSLIILLLAALVINNWFECYFNNTFLIHLNIGGNNVQHTIRQLQTYFTINYGISIILFLLGSYNLLIVLKFIHKNASILTIYNKIKSRINFNEINKPLININSNKVDIFTFMLSVSIILFYFKLGRNPGNWLGYMHHLISPFLIIVVFNFVNNQPQLKIVSLILIILNLYTLSSSKFLYNPNYTYQKWENLSALISQHQNVFNSPAIVSILLEQGKQVYDSGQSEFFVVGAERKSFLKVLLPDGNNIKKRNSQFLQDINKSVISQKYDLIVLTKGYSPFISEDLLKQYYQYQATLPAPMLPLQTRQNWELDIWKPKRS